MRAVGREVGEVADLDAMALREERGERLGRERGIVSGTVVEGGLDLVRGIRERDGNFRTEQARTRRGEFRGLFGEAAFEGVWVGERERFE